MAEVREGTLAEVTKMCFDRNSAAVRHLELLLYIRRVVKVCEKRKDKAADTFVELHKVYEKGHMVRFTGPVAE